MDIREIMIKRLVEDNQSNFFIGDKTEIEQFAREHYSKLSDEQLLDELINDAYLAGIYQGGC